MKLSEIQVGESYYVNANAPTDHKWQDPQKEPYRQIMELLLGDLHSNDPDADPVAAEDEWEAAMETGDPRRVEQAEESLREASRNQAKNNAQRNFGPEQATVRQVLPNVAGWHTTAEVAAIGVPYKKGCHGVLMRANGVEFTVHYSVLRSDAQMVAEWEERRAFAAEQIAKRPDSPLAKRWAESVGLA